MNLQITWTRISWCILFLLVLIPASAFAQQIEMSSSLNPVGSGARAVGMGGAFIGVADDATAASWNPAGLVQLEKPEMSVVYSYFGRSQSYSSAIHPEIGSTNEMDAGGINYASIAYPFELFKRNMIVSLNYQRLYDMNKDVNFNYTWDDVNGYDRNDDISFKQQGHLYALSPAMAVQISPAFYLGATLNFWGDYPGNNGWQSTQTSTKSGNSPSGAIIIKEMREKAVSFEGVNAHIGFLWNFYERLTLGGVYKTPFNAKLSSENRETASWSLPDTNYFFEADPVHTSERLTMQMPASYGLGLAYRHSDKWTLSLDVYRTDWSEFILKDSHGNRTNPITTKSVSEGRLKDTTQVRAGTEYLFIKDKYVIPVRFGLFYDPEPQTGHLDDYYGFSLGTGYARGKFAFDLAYQYRFGNNVSADIPNIEGGKVDVRQHTLMASVIYYFK